MLLLNAIVPNFNVESTEGPLDFYKWLGESWCVLFSHPADFTPVCTTELGRIAVNYPEFVKRNCKLLAHSVDQLGSHVDWVNDIKSYCRDIPGKFPYPIVADPRRELAVALGMMDAQQAADPSVADTVRALFIISPDKRLRLSMFYPTSTGRNVEEILRCIDSLQLTDKYKIIATPASWTPGTKVMILPTASETDIAKAFPTGVERISMPSGKNYVRHAHNY